MSWLQAEIKPRRELLATSEVPERYAGARLQDIPTPELVAVARKYGAQFWDVAERGIAPFMIGAASTWKSTTAAVIAKAVRNVLMLDVAWVNCASDLTRMERAMFNEATSARLEYLKRVPFLVMDDFSQVRQGSRQLDLLVEIGTARFDAMKPTLYTGNVRISKGNYEELNNAVGACLARRMLDASEGFRVLTRGAA